MTLLMLFVLCIFVTSIAAAAGKCPLWVPVFLISVVLLLQYWHG